MKYARLDILPHHINFFAETVENGSENMSSSLWLAAFAIYNTENKFRLSPDNSASYRLVMNFILKKLS